MADGLVQIAEDVWNVRGSFRIGGLLDIGTQATLVRQADGRFVWLDAYALEGPVREEVLALTDGGAAMAALINTHPFHTVHVASFLQDFPHVALFGTARHHALFPSLPWSPLRTEDPALHERFAEDFEFSVPRGVDFIPDNERLHFSSVLVLHRRSGTLHVDDTLTWIRAPLIGGLRFHPTLGAVLEERPGAAAAFRGWAEELAAWCEGADRLVTAHMKALPPADLVLADEVRGALARVESTLDKHEARWG